MENYITTLEVYCKYKQPQFLAPTIIKSLSRQIYSQYVTQNEGGTVANVYQKCCRTTDMSNDVAQLPTGEKTPIFLRNRENRNRFLPIGNEYGTYYHY